MAKFKKGQSGNPSGRPKIPQEFKKLAQEKSLECLEEVVKIAKYGEKEGVRIKACELIMAYGLGKPNQSVEISGSLAMPDELIDRPPRLNRNEWLKQYQVALDQSQLN